MLELPELHAGYATALFPVKAGYQSTWNILFTEDFTGKYTEILMHARANGSLAGQPLLTQKARKGLVMKVLALVPFGMYITS